jgi:LPS-assembly protein
MQITSFHMQDQDSMKRGWTRFLWVLTGILIFAGLASRAWGANMGQLFEENPNAPWHITADTISYDDPSRRYVADGSVRISRGSVRLTADHVRFDHRTMDATASGHVVLVSGKDVLIGDSVDINLQDQIGTVTQGTVFLEENHFYIRGDKIEKLGENTYAAERATLSSCDGQAPAWKITGRNLDVTLEGYGVIRHAALWAKDVPILYTPIFVFPAKRQRQTGLLPPEFGSSSRKGTFYTQPFYWAINEQSDLTVYENYMSDRGNKIGLEYRYKVNPLTEGTAMVDYLKDRKVDDGIGDNSDDWGYTGDNFLRPDDERYWFRMKHDQGLPLGFTGRIDLDIVSDQDYLTDFRRGMTGYDKTREYFRDTYGRDLDDYDDPIRTNQAIATRHWDRFSLNSGIIWLDDTTQRWTDAFKILYPLPKLDTQLQRLPLIRFDAMRQPIGDTPLLFNMDTEWTYFYSDDNTRAARIDLHPRVTWPFRLGQALYIEPSAGLRQTAWFVTNYQDIPTEEAKDDNTYRTLYDLKVVASSEFSNVFTTDESGTEAVRHTVLPQITYEYTPYKDQDDYPAFINQDTNGQLTPLEDTINRVEPLNKITYAITNTFTSKSLARSDKGSEETTETAKYNDFLRVKLQQSYDIREARGNDRIDPERKRPFSPIRAEMEYYPARYLRLKADAEYDVYDNRLVSRNISATLNSDRGDEFRLEYRYDKGLYHFYRKDDTGEDIESLYGSIRLKLPFRFTVYGTNEYDLEENERIETTVGLIYEAQCWSFNAWYEKDSDGDDEIAFMFNLYGLGPIGLY